MPPATYNPNPGQKSLRQGRFSNKNQIYLLTSCTKDRIHRFVDLATGRLLVQAMRHEDEHEFTSTLAYVVMPDHFHWLMQVTGTSSLSTCMQNVKSFSARLFNAKYSHVGSLWQRGFHDHALRREENIEDISRYIIMNPIRAGIVRRIGDYPLWDARWIEDCFRGSRRTKEL